MLPSSSGVLILKAFSRKALEYIGFDDQRKKHIWVFLTLPFWISGAWKEFRVAAAYLFVAAHVLSDAR